MNDSGFSLNWPSVLDLFFAGARDGLWIWNAATDTLRVSENGMKLIGKPTGFEGKLVEMRERLHPEEFDDIISELNATIRPEKPQFARELRLRQDDSEFRWVLVQGCATFTDGKPQMVAGSISDITSQKVTELQLRRQAYQDPLTGLPNRSLFLRQLGRAIRRGCTPKAYALLFLDIDRFKLVNDSLGHAAGDQLLIGISERLQECLRPSDLFARLGGDEFVILLEGLDQPSDATVVAERIRVLLQSPFEVKGQPVYSSASIGIAFGKNGYDSAEDLLRDADTAMYRAKHNGKARAVVFNPEMHVSVYKSIQLETELRQAVRNNELEVFYQPLYRVSPEELIGFEALLRWRHPKLGEIDPPKFIAIAEETGLMSELGDWVLRTACAQVVRWMEVDGFPIEALNVNVSPVQLQQANVVSSIASALEDTRLPPDILHLEITESAFLGFNHVLRSRMSAIRNFGVKLAIDDFGVGYSSLAYLHSYPIDELKIDRSFIERLGQSEDHTAIVRTITTLASHLGLTTVAEGVETEIQLEQLRSINVEYAQGFYMAEPMPAAEAELLLRGYKGSLRAWGT